MLRLGTALLAGMLLANCGGGVAAVRNLECQGYATLPALPEMQYPVNGATNLPDGNFTLVLAFTSGEGLELTSSGAASIALTTATVPNPLPTPNATHPPNSTPAGYAVGALAAHTLYTVTATFAQPAGCPNLTGNIGSFTSQ